MLMGRNLLYLLFLFSFFAQSQVEQHTYLSEAIGKNIKNYTKNSEKAYYDQDFKRADFLFDSLIKHVVTGSYLDNFKVRKLSGRKTQLHKFEKPMFLMTYASWCTPGSGEIPALNEIAEENKNTIDFVILFWDSKENVRKVAKAYSKNINIIYIDEKENTNNHIIEVMKHSLGFPTSFFMDKNKRIVDVRRGTLHPYNENYEISYQLNFNSFLNGITLLKNFNIEDNQQLVVKENP